jgi:hypothetical protein
MTDKMGQATGQTNWVDRDEKRGKGGEEEEWLTEEENPVLQQLKFIPSAVGIESLVFFLFFPPPLRFFALDLRFELASSRRYQNYM